MHCHKHNSYLLSKKSSSPLLRYASCTPTCLSTAKCSVDCLFLLLTFCTASSVRVDVYCRVRELTLCGKLFQIPPEWTIKNNAT